MQAMYGNKRSRTTMFAESAAQLALEDDVANTEANTNGRPSVRYLSPLSHKRVEII